MNFEINSGSSSSIKQKCSLAEMAKSVGAKNDTDTVLEVTAKGHLRISVLNGLYTFPCGQSVTEDTKPKDITLGLCKTDDNAEECWVAFVMPESKFKVLATLAD